mmetsp:Transcript_13930/g.39608  ORF Transcript_13930/g.39608 Transcript_13930/m.39608 type:complete len:279 (+) Transcript_13930:624-1460(+)
MLTKKNGNPPREMWGTETSGPSSRRRRAKSTRMRATPSVLRGAGLFRNCAMRSYTSPYPCRTKLLQSLAASRIWRRRSTTRRTRRTSGCLSHYGVPCGLTRTTWARWRRSGSRSGFKSLTLRRTFAAWGCWGSTCASTLQRSTTAVQSGFYARKSRALRIPIPGLAPASMSVPWCTSYYNCIKRTWPTYILTAHFKPSLDYWAPTPRRLRSSSAWRFSSWQPGGMKPMPPIWSFATFWSIRTTSSSVFWRKSPLPSSNVLVSLECNTRETALPQSAWL